jgi:hypothetical protein
VLALAQSVWLGVPGGGRLVIGGVGGAEQVEFVDLSDEIGSEAVVRFFLDESEAALQVDVARCGEWVIRPQAHTVVPGLASELKRAVEESATETVTSAVGMDEQDPQLRCRVMVGVGDAEDGANPLAIDLSDPGCLSLRVVVGGVVGNDPCDQGLEAGVPTELGAVDLAVSHYDPAEVARLPKSTDRDLSFAVGHKHLLSFDAAH